MIELGKIQKLEVLRITSIGVYLGKDDKTEEHVLLPKKQVPPNTKVGDIIEVFIYRDSEDRIIATTKKTKITIGRLAKLKVVETTRIGAFLDWGLEKDLFLPFREQTCRVQKGKEYLVALYVDKSNRLSATMDVHKDLESNSPYKVDDRVTGTIYKIEKDVGGFVAVDNRYHGLIPIHEFFGDYGCGDEVEARIIEVRDDGKLNLSIRPKAYKTIDEDAELILQKMNSRGGILYLNDESSPEEINQVLNMSKRAFKRAVGRLLKNNRIKITERGIEKI